MTFNLPLFTVFVKGLKFIKLTLKSPMIFRQHGNRHGQGPLETIDHVTFEICTAYFCRCKKYQINFIVIWVLHTDWVLNYFVWYSILFNTKDSSRFLNYKYNRIRYCITLTFFWFFFCIWKNFDWFVMKPYCLEKIL